nr:cupin domain-containing protein [Veillonella denticariosi]
MQILDGEAHIVVGDTEHTVKAGETLIMPSEVPHSLDARENFKMLLTVVK